MDIKNTVALVTGTNRGVGRAIVQALVAGGASKVYAATGIIGRVSFAYNPISDGLPDTDETDNIPPEPAVIDNEKLDAVTQNRSGIKASSMTTAPLGAREPIGDKQSLGRERRKR
jgi:hypothetical protein